MKMRCIFVFMICKVCFICACRHSLVKTLDLIIKVQQYIPDIYWVGRKVVKTLENCKTTLNCEKQSPYLIFAFYVHVYS